MYNLIRFYNQNRKKIFKIILIIVLIIGGIQLFNYFAKQSNNSKYEQKNVINNNTNSVINDKNESQELISNKSLISISKAREILSKSCGFGIFFPSSMFDKCLLSISIISESVS